MPADRPGPARRQRRVPVLRRPLQALPRLRVAVLPRLQLVRAAPLPLPCSSRALPGSPARPPQRPPRRARAVRASRLLRPGPGIQDYLSIDLDYRLAMEKMDVTDLQLPDDRIDVVVCSHVLIEVLPAGARRAPARTASRRHRALPDGGDGAARATHAPGTSSPRRASRWRRSRRASCARLELSNATASSPTRHSTSAQKPGC